MTLNAGIILQGQQPNIVNSLDQGTQLAGWVNANQRQNALAKLYQTQGSGIAAGDPNAINALAGLDPNAAIGVKQAQLGIAQTQQNMDFSAEEMGIMRQDAAIRAESYASGLSAAQVASERDTISRGLAGAGFFYSNGDEAGYNTFLQQNGLDPAQYPFEKFPAIASMFEGVMDTFTAHEDRAAPAAPLSNIGKTQADINSGLLPEGTPLRGTGTNISVNTGGDQPNIPAYPKAPTGYTYKRDQETGQILVDADGGVSLIPMHGGPEDTTTQDAVAAGNKEIATSTITTSAGRAREAATNRTVGGVIGGVVAYNPESRNAEVYRQVEVLKSIAKIENLNAMRAASKTGGALGAVSDKESAMLAAKSGALDPASPHFLRDIDDYELTLLQVVHGPEAGQKIFDQTRVGAPPSQSGDPTDGAFDYDAIPSGTTFTAPDGTTRRKP